MFPLIVHVWIGTYTFCWDSNSEKEAFATFQVLVCEICLFIQGKSYQESFLFQGIQKV